jgi:transcriptional regulator with XRE-family HTH domain
MKKRGKGEQVAVSDAHRQLLRETRERLGLTQAALEKKARVGKTYAWYVETGKTKTTAAVPFLRLITTLQKEATRGDVPARLASGLQKLAQDLEKRRKPSAKR